MIEKKILVLEGGFNEEHEVSIETGSQVKKALKNLNISFESLIVNPKNFKNKISKYENNLICFNALHGTFGEDGGIQKILDDLSFKYTHSGSDASKKGFNKELTKKEIINTEIKTLPSFTLEIKELTEDILYDSFRKFGSFIIKPISSGSSYGINIFKDKNSINLFLTDFKKNKNIYANHSQILIEKFINGRELTVAVLDFDSISVPIDVTEIIIDREFFDYKSKYTPGFAKHVLPANLPNKDYDVCKAYAKIAHDKINCEGVSRSDFIYDDKDVYFLEINTQPGLTPMSLVPEQLKFKKINFEKMLMFILESVK